MKRKTKPGRDFRSSYLIAEQIAQLPKLDDIEQFGPLVLDIMRGVDHRTWHELDEKPGLFGYMDDRFYMLRQVRNHQDWGRRMFDGLTG